MLVCALCRIEKELMRQRIPLLACDSPLGFSQYGSVLRQ